MIVTPTDGRLLVVTQNDHAHLAGELLSLWRADGLPEHPRRRTLLLAAREHDNGWREADSAPRSRRDGRPHDFMSVPRELRWEIWRRGTRRFAGREPSAALLIVRHARELHRAHRADPAWSEILGEWRELEAELMDVTGTDAETLAGDYRWIGLTDRLSLAVCNRWREAFITGALGAITGALGAITGAFSARVDVESDGALALHTLAIHPFPLAGTTTLGVACRLIPDRAYAGDADLGVELAAAHWRQLAIRVAPGEV